MNEANINEGVGPRPVDESPKCECNLHDAQAKMVDFLKGEPRK